MARIQHSSFQWPAGILQVIGGVRRDVVLGNMSDSMPQQVAAAIIIMAFRHVISYIFTEGETVAEAVSDLCPLLAFTLILNGIQPVLSVAIIDPDQPKCDCRK
ncbi:Multi antimicrobial extrusion protein [Corchorus capsularis]|uniref:Multi antimicrobial extrusion protein n=1 Tax=Corchorus capsularis TaxID=210143 RepID=A0A1R3HZ01_COCAP|nr:Multi antimicrobial extrusion protein [Corchorus capsularis]